MKAFNEEIKIGIANSECKYMLVFSCIIQTIITCNINNIHTSNFQQIQTIIATLTYYKKLQRVEL